MDKNIKKDEVNWKKIDWSKVDDEKAKLIYKEAMGMKQEAVTYLNSMNDKAFRLLSIVMTITVGFASLYFINIKDLSRIFLWTGALFIVLQCSTILCLLIAVWPREFKYVNSSPLPYFTNKYYQGSYLEILQGNIMSSLKDMKPTIKSIEKRTLWTKWGFALLFSSFIPVLFLLIWFFCGGRS